LTDDQENANKYYEFIKYFLKNWYGHKITSFETLSDENIKFRTDNPYENFHKMMNSYIRLRKPKLSYFTEHFKELIVEIYNEYIVNWNSKNNNERNKFSISGDIIEFLLKIKINQKQLPNWFITIKKRRWWWWIIYNIGRRILTLLFDFEKDNFKDKNNNSDDNILKTENDDKNSQNEYSDTDENPSDSNNEYNKENINDMIISFEDNIDEILKNYWNKFLKVI